MVGQQGLGLLWHFSCREGRGLGLGVMRAGGGHVGHAGPLWSKRYYFGPLLLQVVVPWSNWSEQGTGSHGLLLSLVLGKLLLSRVAQFPHQGQIATYPAGTRHNREITIDPVSKVLCDPLASGPIVRLGGSHRQGPHRSLSHFHLHAGCLLTKPSGTPLSWCPC